MKFLVSFLLRLCLRLSLGLLLLVGLGIVVAGGSLHAHAAPAATLTVTDCSGQTGTGRIGTVISRASPGDTITFSCSGTIPITSHLIINKNLTLDGSGQMVTLDGGNSTQVLQVLSGVSFTLNALAIAHGFWGCDNCDGGGLYNENGGTVSISNSTFANNSASAYQGGGLLSQDTLNIGGSIVANNSGGNCAIFVTFTDQGYNLESGTDCGFTGTGSLQNTDPKLASGLANNGGPTQTIALLDGSPAIDHIPAANCPATDQRGVTRPDDTETTCDIGAYESNYTPDSDLGLTNMPADITLNATSPQGAVVTYTAPTTTDESGDNPGPTASCDPASGSFQVVVKGAATQVSDLVNTVNSFHLASSLQTTLDNKLQGVLTAINGGQTATACSELTDFIGHVQFQSGKGLTADQASKLIAAAKQVQAVLGC